MTNNEIIVFLKIDLKIIAKVREHFKENPIPEGHPDAYLMEYADKLYESLSAAIKALEKQKTGRWFIDERPESNRETICSNCEQPVFKYHKLDFDYRPKYCPNCGARMDEPQESEGERNDK